MEETAHGGEEELRGSNARIGGKPNRKGDQISGLDRSYEAFIYKGLQPDPIKILVFSGSSSQPELMLLTDPNQTKPNQLRKLFQHLQLTLELLLYFSSAYKSTQSNVFDYGNAIEQRWPKPRRSSSSQQTQLNPKSIQLNGHIIYTHIQKVKPSQ